MKDDFKNKYLQKIASNISTYGHHIQVIQGGPLPRFAYTVGLNEKYGLELIFAGAVFYHNSQVGEILEAAKKLLYSNTAANARLKLNSLGNFHFREVHSTWSKLTALGVFSYYKTNEIKLLQIVPDRHHATIDIPEMSEEFTPEGAPVWQWLVSPWIYNIPKSSRGITNLEALKGQPITEVVRWEEDEWELFAGSGPEVDKADIRAVPMGTLLGFDKSLQKVADLAVGQGLWRDSAGCDWNIWKKP